MADEYSGITSEPFDNIDGADSKEQATITAYGERFADAQLKIELQRFTLRRWAFLGVVAVVLAAGCLEYLILGYIMDLHTIPPNAFIFLAISPIASITLIMIFILIGVFQGYLETDMKKLPGETMAKVAAGHSGE